MSRAKTFPLLDSEQDLLASGLGCGTSLRGSSVICGHVSSSSRT